MKSFIIFFLSFLILNLCIVDMSRIFVSMDAKGSISISIIQLIYHHLNMDGNELNNVKSIKIKNNILAVTFIVNSIFANEIIPIVSHAISKGASIELSTASGSALNPVYTFIANTNMGMFAIAANTLELSTNGV